ncbi:interleukin-21 receptor [Sorex fumeus]|uniref:interleukin-21 receptor n=1 Tax=Sorex fumeus TaxID=62283 RepID=UPI0024AD6B4C|nr:interleukin-21 receptor [Sorex fumeus]
MRPGWGVLLLLLTLQAAPCVLGSLQTQDMDSSGWGCPNPDCYTDYLQTVTCLLETGPTRPGMLTLTWEDPDGELEDEVTSCHLRGTAYNATHTQYMCHMDVFRFMPDDFFSVTATGPWDSCKRDSFMLAERIQPPAPVNVSVAFSGSYNVSWSCTYDSAPGPTPLRDRLQFELLYCIQGNLGEPRRKLVSVSARSVSLLPLEFRPGASYVLWVRAGPLPGSLFAGTWSEWSEPATFHTPPAGASGLQGDLRMCLVLLILVPVLVFLGLKFFQPGRLTKAVPSPEHFFLSLYKAHGGDFKKWVGTPFTASSLELGPWSQGTPSSRLEPCSSGPGSGKGAEAAQLTPEPQETDAAPAAAHSPERDRPYGLVSIDTVTVVDAEGPWACACAEDGYPALSLDPDPAGRLRLDPTVLACGCVSDEPPARPGDALDSLLGAGAGGEPGSPPASLDMDTFDSGFAGSDCGSPVDEPPAEGAPRSYLRQWVLLGPAAGE